MKVVLELQDQPSNIKKVTVRHDIVIGRGAECNLRLSAPQVSRRHCFLRIGSAGAFVSDLDSSNGTTLDGDKLTSGKRYPLKNGAVLAIGPAKFVARVVSEVAASEVLDVAKSGGQAEADRVNVQASGDFEDTIAGYVPDEDGSSMDFAIEQGGPAVAEDEPTADCVVDPGYLAGSSEDELLIDVPEEPESLLGDLPDFDAPTTSTPPKAVVEEVELIEEVEEVVELVDDEGLVEILAEDIIEESDEILELVEDDEILLLDEDDIIEESSLQDAPDSHVANAGDRVENELKDFLQGLD